MMYKFLLSNADNDHNVEYFISRRKGPFTQKRIILRHATVSYEYTSSTFSSFKRLATLPLGFLFIYITKTFYVSFISLVWKYNNCKNTFRHIK